MLLATDADDVHEARMAARPDHLKRLEALQAEGRLLTAGPNPLPDNPDASPAALSSPNLHRLTKPKNGQNKILMSLRAYMRKF